MTQKEIQNNDIAWEQNGQNFCVNSKPTSFLSGMAFRPFAANPKAIFQIVVFEKSSIENKL